MKTPFANTRGQRAHSCVGTLGTLGVRVIHPASDHPRTPLLPTPQGKKGVVPPKDGFMDLDNHPATTPEIRSLCEDLGVLGKVDFKLLLKWYGSRLCSLVSLPSLNATLTLNTQATGD